MKIKRKIIRIDEGKCDGCGLCIPACPEGALRIINGKAKLVKENFCDGLGACLGDCPRGALAIEEKEVEQYDKEGVIEHIKEESPELLKKHIEHLKEHADEFPDPRFHSEAASCPSARILHWKNKKAHGMETVPASSELRQWPIQLHLLPANAPYLKNSHLILAADCVPFACADFHANFLRGKTLAIGCPKFDDRTAYVDKIAQILENSDIKSLKVVHMEVPCCHGLINIAKESLKKSGKDIPFETVMIGIEGNVKGGKSHKKDN